MFLYLARQILTRLVKISARGGRGKGERGKGKGERGQLLNSSHVSDPGVNFASVYDVLASVTVHMSFSVPRATSRGGLPTV